MINAQKDMLNVILKILYKEIILMDMFLEKRYGLDSQIYINFHDCLNVLSLDRDREDTKKEEPLD